jgi:hypothetical protein
MHFGETIGLLLLLTLAVLVLRFFWQRIPPRTEKFILSVAVVFVAVRFLALVTLWTTVSPWFNALIAWLSVSGYEIILARFSLMRPRWLTSFCAVVLLLPILGSVLLMPLTGIFDTKPADITRLGKNYLLERSSWDVTVSGKEGHDFGVFYSPSFAPFLRRVVQRSSLSEEQCDSKGFEVHIDAAKKLVHFHCPGRAGAASDIDLILPLK